MNRPLTGQDAEDAKGVAGGGVVPRRKESGFAVSKTAKIVFTPSGKRGEFPVGTPVLDAARQLGVDVDSVCGGRALCGRCQITPPKASLQNTRSTRSLNTFRHLARSNANSQAAEAQSLAGRTAAELPGTNTG